jgi:hypothetical protein
MAVSSTTFRLNSLPVEILQKANKLFPSRAEPISSPLDIPNHLSPAEPIKIPLPSDALSPDGTVNLSLNLYGSRQGEHDLLLMLAYRTTVRAFSLHLCKRRESC